MGPSNVHSEISMTAQEDAPALAILGPTHQSPQMHDFVSQTVVDVENFSANDRQPTQAPTPNPLNLIHDVEMNSTNE